MYFDFPSVAAWRTRPFLNEIIEQRTPTRYRSSNIITITCIGRGERALLNGNNMALRGPSW